MNSINVQQLNMFINDNQDYFEGVKISHIASILFYYIHADYVLVFTNK